jgi:aldoxime dehydratase
VAEGARRRVLPQANLCLIRSGQDWGDTEADERRMYEQDVEPVLRAGMDFLRDEGLAIGAMRTAICACWAPAARRWTRASA